MITPPHKIPDEKPPEGKPHSWADEHVTFGKTFLINDQRNNQGWKVSWESIERRHASFVGTAGTEFKVCSAFDGCRLDHLPAGTKGYLDDVDRGFKEGHPPTRVVATQLDASTKTAYAIHRAITDEGAQKIRNGNLRYVSPGIRPDPEQLTASISPEGRLNIDVGDWRGLHLAWVDRGAYGPVASTYGTCEGDRCDEQLAMLAASLDGTCAISQKIRETLVIGALTASGADRQKFHTLLGQIKRKYTN